MFTKSEIQKIIDTIVEQMQPSRILLFGSYAKGRANINSDLDLLVIKRSKLPPAKRVYEIEPYVSSYAIPVNVLVYTPEELESDPHPMSFLNCVKRTAKEVYRK